MQQLSILGAGTVQSQVVRQAMVRAGSKGTHKKKQNTNQVKNSKSNRKIYKDHFTALVVARRDTATARSDKITINYIS